MLHSSFGLHGLHTCTLEASRVTVIANFHLARAAGVQHWRSTLRGRVGWGGGGGGEGWCVGHVNQLGIGFTSDKESGGSSVYPLSSDQCVYPCGLPFQGRHTHSCYHFSVRPTQTALTADFLSHLPHPYTTPPSRLSCSQRSISLIPSLASCLFLIIISHHHHHHHLSPSLITHTLSRAHASTHPPTHTPIRTHTQSFVL